MATKMDRILEICSQVRESFTFSEAFAGRVEELHNYGNELKGLCPFHNDRHLGSFSASESKGVWKCFSCGCGGDAISFVRDYENTYHNAGLTYSQVSLQIAFQKNLITEEEFNHLSTRVSSNDELRIEKICNKREIPKVANTEILNKVYTLFSSVNEFQGKPRLSESHKQHLINERHLTEQEIEDVGYFSFPTKHAVRKFLVMLEENQIPVDILREVPGFFFDIATNRFEFTTYPSTAIGIPIRNKDGQIVAIQLRKDTVKEREVRYVWFSSVWAQGKKGKSYGCSCGAPINVIYPSEKRTNSLYITEGHFKAMQIAKKMGAVVLSVQGVSTWKALLPILKQIEHSYVYIAYDADMAYNEGVYLQAIKMGIALTDIPELVTSKSLNLLGKKGVDQMDVWKDLYSSLYKEYMNPETKTVRKDNRCLHIRYVLWDALDGKGIDDFLDNHSSQELKYLNIAMMFVKYIQYVKELNKRYETLELTQDIPEEEKRELFNSIILK